MHPIRTGPSLDPATSCEIRREMELSHCKWDAQVGDVSAIADFPLLISRATWAELAHLAERSRRRGRAGPPARAGMVDWTAPPRAARVVPRGERSRASLPRRRTRAGYGHRRRSPRRDERGARRGARPPRLPPRAALQRRACAARDAWYRQPATDHGCPRRRRAPREGPAEGASPRVPARCGPPRRGTIA